MKPLRLLAVAALAAATVGAAPIPATAAGPCGSSFSLVGTYAKSGSGHSAELRVYYSSAYRQNCAVMAKTNQTDHKDYIGVMIRPTGGSVDKPGGVDDDWYYSYAGPVYTDAAVNMSGRCVDVDGFIGDGFSVLVHIQKNGVHCG
jgi:hypothetical protein